jgi:hypothetical protein
MPLKSATARRLYITPPLLFLSSLKTEDSWGKFLGVAFLAAPGAILNIAEYLDFPYLYSLLLTNGSFVFHGC